MEKRKRQYPHIKPIRVARAPNEYRARRIEATLIRNEVLVLNWEYSIGNSIYDQDPRCSDSPKRGCLEPLLAVALIVLGLSLFFLFSHASDGTPALYSIDGQDRSAINCEPAATASQAAPDNPCG